MTSRPSATRGVLRPLTVGAKTFAALLFACALPVSAQFTDNLAPRISLGAVSTSARADTLCVTMSEGANLGFSDISASDADVAAADLHVRVELTPGPTSGADVLIPDLAGLPGVTIIRERPDRIRFNAPLSSVNAAIAALQYRSAGDGDMLEIIVDDQQLPPLSAEFLLHVTTQISVPTTITRCLPPPDLRAASDTGESASDDITAATAISFDVSGLIAGDVVDLLNDAVPIAQVTATGSTTVISDPAPARGVTGLYAVSVNAGLPSAALSVAVVDAPAFSVGGTVSGLLGSGLKLQINGGDDLTISANGVFAFSSALFQGSAYTVSVLQQPSAPDQNCTVGNATGTVVDDAITNVSVVCKTIGFSIGGSVSGLAGSGLVLRNNGVEDLPVDANGSFAFTTRLGDGATYAITVQQQPTALSQTCSVQNGSGEVMNADVTNILVTCVTDSFTIGGSVTGLSGSGLVLQNNGSDDLAIVGNGSFTFPFALLDGSNFAVTVAVQPSGPAQLCTVSQGSGVLAGANITDVLISCVTGSFNLSVVSGSQQVAFFGEPFANVLVTSLRDAADAPVAGADVLFQSPILGATALLDDGSQPAGLAISVQTDTLGLAMITATANNEAGCYSVLASSEGSPTVAEFHLRNVNPQPIIHADGFEDVPPAPGAAGVCP